ncbi:MAG: AtpZ/AtpI family protein [bacterium]|nr:AtpZ/AtpI family protein [bacterium]
MVNDPDDNAGDRSESVRERVRLQRELGRYAGLGLQLGASITVLALGGYWLDGRLGTLPLFLLLGVFAGFVGGTIAIIRKVPPPTGGRPSKPSSD